MTEPTARFDDREHCTIEGVATYQESRRVPFRCRLLGHRWIPIDGPKNGHSPRDFTHCKRGCRGHWFVDGQHRRGSINRYFANLADPLETP